MPPEVPALLGTQKEGPLGPVGLKPSSGFSERLCLENIRERAGHPLSACAHLDAHTHMNT